MNKPLIDPDVLQNINKAADALTGIPKLDVIRNVVNQIAGSITADILQINNYPIIAVKTKGRQLNTVQDKIAFVKEKVKGSIYEPEFLKILDAPHGAYNKIIFDVSNINFTDPGDRVWFNENYMMILCPVWMMFANNRELQEKYQIVFDEQEQEGLALTAAYNSSEQRGLQNMFGRIKQETYYKICASMLKMTKDIASIFHSNLLYFTAINSKANRSIPPDENGLTSVTAEQIGTEVVFYMQILEKTPRYVSLYSWKYDQQTIRDILTRNNMDSKEELYTMFTANPVTYEEIAQFITIYQV